MNEEIRNFTKVKSLLYLYYIANDFSLLLEYPGKVREGKGSWATIPDIAEYAEVNQGSLYVLMPRWAEWGYVKRVKFSGGLMSDNHAHWLHHIDGRGISYIKRLERWYPRLNEAKAVFDNEDRVFVPTTDPRGIVWHVPPSKAAIAIEWPFKTEDAAHPQYFWGGSFRAKDADDAFELARFLFGVTPSDEVCQYAIALQNFYLEKALNEIKQKVGITEE